MSRERSSNREHGFSLIELIVVIGIVAILAAIALSQFARYKARSIDAQMQSELAHARVAMEAFYERNDYTYVGTTQADLENWGYRQTSEVDLDILLLTPTDYSLRACANGGTFASYVFSTSTGRIEEDPIGACSP